MSLVIDKTTELILKEMIKEAIDDYRNKLIRLQIADIYEDIGDIARCKAWKFLAETPIGDGICRHPSNSFKWWNVGNKFWTSSYGYDLPIEIFSKLKNYLEIQPDDNTRREYVSFDSCYAAIINVFIREENKL